MRSVLAVVCPPLAVLLTSPLSFPKSCCLTLLLFVPGVLHARDVVEKHNANRRYDALMRVLDDHDGVGVARTQAA